MTTTATPRWGKLSDAASECGVSTKTIRRMIARGEIYGERIGPRLIRVDLDTIQGRSLQYKGGDDA